MTKFDLLKLRFPDLMPVQQLRTNVSIIELAIHHGYQLQPHKGKKRPVLVHPTYQDIILIKNPQDAAQQLYQRAGHFIDSGTLIDFVRNRLPTVFARFNQPHQHPFRNITNVLYDYLQVAPTPAQPNPKVITPLVEASPKPAFDIEQFDLRPLEPDNYLTRRQITPLTLQRPEFAGKVLTQVAYYNPQTGCIDSFSTAKAHSQHHYRQFTNVAFPYYNSQSGEITGLEVRNENIKRHAPGSDRSASVFVSNAPAKAVDFYVMESAIDALSHQQLRSIRGDERFDSVYFSTGGQLTPQQVDTIVGFIGGFDKAPNWKIKLAFDQDVNGCRFDLQFIQHLASTALPMHPTLSGVSRCSYVLAQSDADQPLQEALLSRLEAYNQTVLAPLALTHRHEQRNEELSNEPIRISRSTNQLIVSVPESCQALTAFCQALLALTGLDQRVMLAKAQGKDYNEDLTRSVTPTEGDH